MADNFFFLILLLLPTDLSVIGEEADSLITSNMAPMFPAFKGEPLVCEFQVKMKERGKVLSKC